MSSSKPLSAQFSSVSNAPESYQLSLFAQAKDLMHYPTDDAGAYGSLTDFQDMHDRKLEEGKMGWDDYNDNHGLIFEPEEGEESLYDSINKKGVQTPVDIRLREKDGKYEPILTNGNHRVAIAHDINPNMYIPLHYTDSMYGSFRK